MNIYGKYFYGFKISEYGIENKRVDYATLAKATSAILNNDIMQKTDGICGYWEQESGFIDNTEEKEKIENRIAEIENALEEIEEGAEKEALEEEKEALEYDYNELENEENDFPEIFQFYIVDYQGAQILEEVNEIVFYNSELDLYLWGITHYGTSWDYVLTDIPCCTEEV